jgi:hypothetical protein
LDVTTINVETVLVSNVVTAEDVLSLVVPLEKSCLDVNPSEEVDVEVVDVEEVEVEEVEVEVGVMKVLVM